MSFRIYLYLFAFAVGLAAKASAASTLCPPFSTTERLDLYCLTEMARLQPLRFSHLQRLGVLLGEQGYDISLELPSRSPRTTIRSYAHPIVTYSSNINGGDPDRPLKLGSLEFVGDEDSVAKSGVLFGGSLHTSGRHLYGEGRYLQFSLGAAGSYSPKHEAGIVSSSAALCSKNHIKNWWYLDFCARAASTTKELSADVDSSITVELSKLFTSPLLGEHEVSVAAQRGFFENYTQNQVAFSLGSVHPAGIYSSLKVTYGFPVNDALALHHSIEANMSTFVLNRRFTASALYRQARGGTLFGFARDEDTVGFSLSYAVYGTIAITAGYSVTRSEIDYFDRSEPVLQVGFPTIRF